MIIELIGVAIFALSALPLALVSLTLGQAVWHWWKFMRKEKSYKKFIGFCRSQDYAEPSFGFYIKYIYKKKANWK